MTLSSTPTDPVTETRSGPPRSPVRELFGNRWLLAFLAVWAAAATYIIGFADRSVLPQSEPEVTGYYTGVVGASVVMALLFWLSRRQPVQNYAAPHFSRQPSTETAGLLLYAAAVLIIGNYFGIRTHIAFVGLGEGAQSIWEQQTRTDVLVWAAYNFVALAVIPFAFFRYRLGYRSDAMLLRFPRPKIWLSYAIVVGTLGFLPAADSRYFETAPIAHLLTFVLFTVGTLIPIMIFTQSLLTPRLAAISGSWVTGAVLSAVAYGALNITEAFFGWGSTEQILLSLAWFMQVAFWGLVKAVTTLRTGNAWLHISTTHTIHFIEAPAVADVFGIEPS